MAAKPQFQASSLPVQPGLLPAPLLAEVQDALRQATAELLRWRTTEGYWAGELSASALSTATAVCAMALAAKAGAGRIQNDILPRRVRRALDWLAEHHNSDGGWGDTLLSRSNLSTTTLVWAAFGAAGPPAEPHQAAVRGAEQWLEQHGAGVTPATLQQALLNRYGKDRTFSVPILTMCALAGRLGTGTDAWKWVPALPFELAALPHQLFSAIRMPVVSYALPALIAIGQARHHHSPPHNPVLRWIRQRLVPSTLSLLRRIQPASGGFLEAVPLTSFVTMSLVGSGQADHPVCLKGLEFLSRLQRQDASWPIDTNLATWLTTLAVNAMPDPASGPGSECAWQTRSWLLHQQYQTVHPYTHARPGGWAWTDLSGGVPDGDDTAGALLALRRLGPVQPNTVEAAQHALLWLLALQNTDGGVPTFCRGWGHLPFDRSTADVTAHALRAWLAWWPDASAEMRDRLSVGISKATAFLIRTQDLEGSWKPLWFGNQFTPGEENPVFGTARVLPALSALLKAPGDVLKAVDAAAVLGALRRGMNWLIHGANPDGSWGGSALSYPSIEETALALHCLADLARNPAMTHQSDGDDLIPAIVSGTGWLVARFKSGEWTRPAPIGLYFARLWYYEQLYPIIFTVAALSELATIRE